MEAGKRTSGFEVVSKPGVLFPEKAFEHMHYPKLIILFTLLFASNSTMGQWTQVNSGTSLNLIQIVFADSMNGFIIAGDGAANIPSILLKTTDGGINWTPVLSNFRFTSIHFLNADTGAVLGHDTIYKTFDGGDNWTMITTYIPTKPSLFHMFDVNNWLYVTGQRHGHTTDGGITWTEISLGNSGQIPTVPTDMQFINDSTVIGIGWYSNVTFKSEDKGQSWEKLGELKGGFLWSICLPTATIAYASGSNGIFKSTDGAVTFNSVHSLNPVRCVRHIDENTVYAVGDSGVILKTTDGGISWNKENSGTTEKLNAIFILPGKAIIIGDNGTILTNSNAPLSVPEEAVKENIVKVYPNPFTQQTTIVSDKYMNNATLTIYNSTGQQVKQMKNISGQEFTLNRDDLVSGFYFLRMIQDNNLIMTKKIVLTD